MPLRALLLLCSVTLAPTLAAAQDWPAPDRQDWQRYVVPETRASVDVPTGLFSDDAGVPDSGPGRRFVTADGRANLIVQSVPNDSGDSPASFLAKKRPPANIVYRRVTPNFFVVSSFRDDMIWYNRCNRGRAAMHCVLINYPAAEKRQWDAVVTRISRTLTSGT